MLIISTQKFFLYLSVLFSSLLLFTTAYASEKEMMGSEVSCFLSSSGGSGMYAPECPETMVFNAVAQCTIDGSSPTTYAIQAAENIGSESVNPSPLSEIYNVSPASRLTFEQWMGEFGTIQNFPTWSFFSETGVPPHISPNQGGFTFQSFDPSFYPDPNMDYYQRCVYTCVIEAPENIFNESGQCVGVCPSGETWNPTGGCIPCDPETEDCPAPDPVCFIPDYTPTTTWQQFSNMLESAPIYAAIGRLGAAFTPPLDGDLDAPLIWEVLKCDPLKPESFACKYTEVTIDMETCRSGICPLTIVRGIVLASFGLFLFSLFYRR